MLPQQKEATFTLICSIVFTLLLLLVAPMFKMSRNEAILMLFGLFIISLWLMSCTSPSLSGKIHLFICLI